MVSWGRGLTPVVEIPMLTFCCCRDRNFEVIILNVGNYANKNMDIMKREKKILKFLNVTSTDKKFHV